MQNNEVNYDIPICIFIFLRKKQTLELIDILRRIKPKKLYIVGEGHRPDRVGEKEKVLEIRKKVESAIDWPCEINKNYVPEDIGAGKRIYSGINWVFEHEERCIFLEDDIRPSVSFFSFCRELLNYYEHDSRIGLITGFNPLGNYAFQDSSYGFSYCGSIYGWATWKNRWEKYDWNMSTLESCIDYLIPQMTGKNKSLARRRVYKWIKSKKQILDGKVSTWDYQWDITRRTNNWLDIVPSCSLTENCGIDDFARSGPTKYRLMPRRIRKIFTVRKNELSFPLIHPKVFIRDSEYDDKYMSLLIPNKMVVLFDLIIKRVKKFFF